MADMNTQQSFGILKFLLNDLPLIHDRKYYYQLSKGTIELVHYKKVIQIHNVYR